jgi:methyl-accepting chemotaxis protein
MFKAHGSMERYKQNAYKDDPKVASELVKFLVINRGIEAIEKVVTKVEVMEVEVTTIKREARTASRVASTASNKIEELKKVVDALV